MNKSTLYTLVAILIGGSFIGVVMMYQNTVPVETVSSQELEGVGVTFYRSPTCGCCAGHAAALEAAGAIVDMQNVDEVTLQNIKQEHNIPFNKQSCHTAIIDDYVVEGHVPVDALAQFLEEAPDTMGITLPGMPIGTPGMPGRQTEPYIVETLEGDVYWRKDPS
jgi:hypothetical protein